MTDRIVEVAEPGVRLSVRHDQLAIAHGENTVTTPLDELAVLVIAHPRVELTQSVLSRLAAKGGMAVICDDAFLPAAMSLPVQSHFVQTERFAAQVEMKQPMRKRLWQEIVRAKIRAQGALLRELHGQDGGLCAMGKRVRSGDPDNLEAQAARRYWPLLFPGGKFHRMRQGDDQNRHLNYGYTVLRAVVARAVCAAGLHPSIGVQHKNRYDPFCLAADVMEPLRPLVDRAVVHWVRDNDALAPLDKLAKAALVQPMLERYVVGGEVRSLFDVCAHIATALALTLSGQRTDFNFPEVERCPSTAAASAGLHASGS